MTPVTDGQSSTDPFNLIIIKEMEMWIESSHGTLVNSDAVSIIVLDKHFDGDQWAIIAYWGDVARGAGRGGRGLGRPRPGSAAGPRPK